MNEGNKPMDILPGYTRKFLKDPPQLLSNFHYEDLLAFVEMGKEEKYKNGDIILPENEPVNAAFLIAEGRISMWKENVQISAVQEGHFIGEVFLFSRQNLLPKVQSDSDAVVLRYEKFEVLTFFRKRPGKLFNIFTKNIIEIQQARIHGMNLQLMKLKKRLLDENRW